MTEQFVGICSAVLRRNAFCLCLCASLFTVADKERYGIFPAISCPPLLLFLYLPTRRSHPKRESCLKAILSQRHCRWQTPSRVPTSENKALPCADLVPLIEGSEFAFKSCIDLWCLQCHLVGLETGCTKDRHNF